MKTKYIVYAILLIALGSLIIYRISANKSSENKGSGPGKKGGNKAAMRVSGVVLQPRPFANSLAVTGTIEANEQVQIRSEISGRVRGISFKEGSRVKKGQVLLKLDDSELRAQLAQAQTRQQLAAENERRAGLLLQKEAISKEEFDVARADLLTAQAQTQLIQAQLAKTSIRAPFSGQIGLRNISEGGFLSPDMVVANLVNTDPVKITFSVPEKYSNQVKPNTQIQFSIAGSSERFSASIYAIEPGIESATRTLQLRASAANPEGILRPGSFANIIMPLNSVENALLVPSEALIPVQGGKKVFVAKNGKAQELKVETGTRTEKNVVITSGLAAGDTVLTTGIMTLKPGSPVKVSVSKNSPEQEK